MSEISILRKSVEKAGFFVGSMIINLEKKNLPAMKNSKIKDVSGTYVVVDNQ